MAYGSAIGSARGGGTIRQGLGKNTFITSGRGATEPGGKLSGKGSGKGRSSSKGQSNISNASTVEEQQSAIDFAASEKARGQANELRTKQEAQAILSKRVSGQLSSIPKDQAEGTYGREQIYNLKNAKGGSISKASSNYGSPVTNILSSGTEFFSRGSEYLYGLTDKGKKQKEFNRKQETEATIISQGIESGFYQNKSYSGNETGFNTFTPKTVTVGNESITTFTPKNFTYGQTRNPFKYAEDIGLNTVATTLSLAGGTLELGRQGSEGTGKIISGVTTIGSGKGLGLSESYEQGISKVKSGVAEVSKIPINALSPLVLGVVERKGYKEYKQQTGLGSISYIGAEIVPTLGATLLFSYGVKGATKGVRGLNDLTKPRVSELEFRGVSKPKVSTTLTGSKAIEQTFTGVKSGRGGSELIIGRSKTEILPRGDKIMYGETLSQGIRTPIKAVATRKGIEYTLDTTKSKAFSGLSIGNSLLKDSMELYGRKGAGTIGGSFGKEVTKQFNKPKLQKNLGGSIVATFERGAFTDIVGRGFSIEKKGKAYANFPSRGNIIRKGGIGKQQLKVTGTILNLDRVSEFPAQSFGRNVIGESNPFKSNKPQIYNVNKLELLGRQETKQVVLGKVIERQTKLRSLITRQTTSRTISGASQSLAQSLAQKPTIVGGQGGRSLFAGTGQYERTGEVGTIALLSQRQSSSLITPQSFKNTLFLANEQEQKPVFVSGFGQRTITKDKQGTIFVSAFAQPTAQAQQQRQRQSSVLRNVPRTQNPFLNEYITGEFIKPFAILPSLPQFDSGLAKRGRSKSRKGRYSPSFTASILNIRSSRQPRVLAGGFSPFQIRNILTTKKQKKKKRR